MYSTAPGRTNAASTAATLRDVKTCDERCALKSARSTTAQRGNRKISGGADLRGILSTRYGVVTCCGRDGLNVDRHKTPACL